MISSLLKTFAVLCNKTQFAVSSQRILCFQQYIHTCGQKNSALKSLLLAKNVSVCSLPSCSCSATRAELPTTAPLPCHVIAGRNPCWLLMPQAQHSHSGSTAGECCLQARSASSHYVRGTCKLVHLIPP